MFTFSLSFGCCAWVKSNWKQFAFEPYVSECLCRIIPAEIEDLATADRQERKNSRYIELAVVRFSLYVTAANTQSPFF